MKDPFVSEIRKFREEHAKQFNFDLHAICEDLRKYQKAFISQNSTIKPAVEHKPPH